LFAVDFPGGAHWEVVPTPATDVTSAGPAGARADAWQWLRVVLLVSNLAWTTACLGGVLPSARGVTCCLTAALVAVHFADPLRGRRAHAAGWLFLPFVAYAAANAAWVTPVHWAGWTDWINWAQAVAVFWVVLNGIEAPACRRLVCACLAAIGAAAGILAVYQHFVRPDWIMLGRTQAAQFIGRASGPFGIPNSLGVLMALLIPPVAFAALRRGPAPRRILLLAVLCLLFTGFVLAISRGAWISLAVAFGIRALFHPGRSLWHRLAGAAAAVAAAAAIAAVLYFTYAPMRVRADQLVKNAGEKTRPIMWRGALQIFEEHPVLGGGAGSFDYLFEPFRPEGYIDEPVYAHCDYLNTLCDYGLAGFVLFFGAAGLVFWRCSGAVGLAGAAFTGLVAFAVHLLVDFHLKIPALAMIAATVAALVTREAWPDDGRRQGAGGGSRAAGLLVSAAALLAAVFWIIPKFRGDELRRASRVTIDEMAKAGSDVSRQGAVLAVVRDSLGKAVRLDPSNAQAWSDKAYAESLLALADPPETASLGAEVCRDAQQAIALSPVVPEFWIRLGTGFDMQARWLDGGPCFDRAIQLAPNRADTWYYEAYHLSLMRNQAGPALSDAELSLRLDPGFLLAQLLRQRLALRLQQRP
jgi:hypothetical protein